MSLTVNTAASAADCVRAIHHVAALFESKATGGPGEFQIPISPPLANPNLVIELGNQLPQVDDLLRLRVSVTPMADGTLAIVLQVDTPMYWFTSSLGFDKDAERSFATTLSATLNAYGTRGRVPTFPAPPRPPKL
ncbi:hypothetical protein ACLM5J_19330 [Nocardioides sp. Bht2]|uniref:hypothetical protein n=1 Tax=Nocardioides sp. Bht2 TaxID=3392297 RepID=UPI0039B4F9FC